MSFMIIVRKKQNARSPVRGYTAGTFVTQERTGVLVDVTKLKEDVKHWEAQL